MAETLIKTDVSVPGDLDLSRSELGAEFPELFDTLSRLAQEQAGGDPAKQAKIMQGMTSSLFRNALKGVEGRLHESGRYAASRGGQAARANVGLSTREEAMVARYAAHEKAMRDQLVSALIQGGATLGAATVDWAQGLPDKKTEPLDLAAVDARREELGLPPEQRPYARPAGYAPPKQPPEPALLSAELTQAPELGARNPLDPAVMQYRPSPGDSTRLARPGWDAQQQPPAPPAPQKNQLLNQRVDSLIINS